MVSIRKAKVQDAKTIVSLLKQLGYDSQKEQLVATIKDTNRSDILLVAEVEGQVIGLMTLIVFDYFPTQEKICRVTTLVIDENIRGQGIGKQLLDMAKNQATEFSCKTLEVSTNISRKETQRFYRNYGFEQCSYRFKLALSY